jgi:hypothetical protein
MCCLKVNFYCCVERTVNSESFDLLHDINKDHEVFRRTVGQHGNLLKQQHPVCLHLLVFLYSLGASGSDCNN